jgi:hypothetical protein
LGRQRVTEETISMARGRPRKNSPPANDVLIRSAELIGWALGGLEREILETKNRLAALTAQANALRSRIAGKGKAGAARPFEASTPAPAPDEQDTDAPSPQPATRRRKRKKGMSPEARKKMSEMMKQRWAERKKKA